MSPRASSTRARDLLTSASSSASAARSSFARVSHVARTPSARAYCPEIDERAGGARARGDVLARELSGRRGFDLGGARGRLLHEPDLGFGVEHRGHRRPPRRAARVGQREDLRRVAHDAFVVGAPALAVRANEEQRDAVVSRGRAREAAFRRVEDAVEVVGRHARLRRGDEPSRGFVRLAAELVVLGEEHRIACSVGFEPRGREGMTELPIMLGQHRVRRVAHERVPERVLRFAGDARRRARDDRLAAHEDVEPRREVERALADQRPHASGVERLSEDARGAKDASRVGIEAVETRLDEREDALRQRDALLVRRGPKELFEEERVAHGSPRDRGDDVFVGARAERVTRDRLAGFLRQVTQRKRLDAALRPELREHVQGLGPREREDEQRAVRERPQRVVDERHGRSVTPMEILEREHDRTRGELRGEPRLPDRAQSVVHDLRIAPRGGDLRRLGGDRDADEATREIERRLHVGEAKCDEVRAQLRLVRVVVRDARRVAQHPAEERERRARGHRVAAPDPHRRVRRVAPDVRDHFAAQARFSPARRRRDEDGARRGLGDALFEKVRDERHLPLAADERRLFAEQRRVRREPLRPLREEGALFAARVDVEAVGEQRRRHFIDDDGRRHHAPRLAQQCDRAIDDHADRQRHRHVAASRRDRHRRVRKRRAQEKRRARDGERLLRRVRVAPRNAHERPVDEPLDAKPSRGDSRLHRDDVLRRDRVRRHGRRHHVGRLVPVAGEQNADEAVFVRGERRSARPRRPRRLCVSHGARVFERGDRARHLDAVGWTQRRILREHRRAELVDGRRDVRADVARPRRIGEEDLREQRDDVLGAKRGLPSQALVEDAPEREDVGARVSSLCPRACSGAM